MSPAAPVQSVDVASTVDLLRGWLARRISADAMAWLDGEIGRQRENFDERRLGIALGLVGRRVGRVHLALSAADLETAKVSHPRWRPDFWGTDEAARVALLLATWIGDAELFARQVEVLCVTGELSEQVACLKGFAVFPASELIMPRAREAARSSIQSVFEALASWNPYPANHFETAAFNHLVVKCVFSGVPVETVIGFDERRNDDLVRMLRDFALERHAAGRPIPKFVLDWIDQPRFAKTH